MRSIDLLAVWYLFIFGGFVPYLSIQSSRKVRAGAPIPPKKKIFLHTVIMELLFLGIALFAAAARHISVFNRGTLSPTALLTAAAFLAIALGAMPLLWKYSSDERKKRTLLSRPEATSDLGGWLAVSLAAGVVEEIVYRGVMLALVLPMTQNWYAAVGICVLCFALGHGNQGMWRAAFVGALATGFHALVALTGSLFLAMTVHFTYDFIAGVIYIRLAKQFHSAPAASQQPA